MITRFRSRQLVGVGEEPAMDDAQPTQVNTEGESSHSLPVKRKRTPRLAITPAQRRQCVRGGGRRRPDASANEGLTASRGPQRH
jgi:hypothetical protein